MGRPPAADRDAIVRASLEVGFSRITMSAVGAHLGISHSTLYGYFRNRDELITAAIEYAVNAIEWPEPGDDWRAFLADTAWAHWRLYMAHPGLAKEITALRITGPALVRRDNRTGVRLLELGFSPVDAALVMDMLAELVTQAFLADPGHGDQAAGEEAPPDAIQRRRREIIEPWLGLYDSRLRVELERAVSGAAEAWFERKLSLFLDGVAGLRGAAE
jgi:AcrR family transcriptional regulator